MEQVEYDHKRICAVNRVERAVASSVTATCKQCDRGSKAFNGVCDTVCDSVCLFVCLHDKTETAETKIAKLGTGPDSPSRYVNLAHQLILGQMAKSQGHRVTKCKKAIEWPA